MNEVIIPALIILITSSVECFVQAMLTTPGNRNLRNLSGLWRGGEQIDAEVCFGGLCFGGTRVIPAAAVAAVAAFA